MDSQLTQRSVAVCAWLAAIVPLLALVAFLAAYRFDTGRFTHRGGRLQHSSRVEARRIDRSTAADSYGESGSSTKRSGAYQHSNIATRGAFE